MAKAQYVAYLSITIGSSDWTPIAALIDCDYFAILNTPGGWFGYGAQSITLRSDSEDENTEKPVIPGAQEVISSPPMPWGDSRRRFPANSVMVWAKADSGSAEIVVTCVR